MNSYSANNIENDYSFSYCKMENQILSDSIIMYNA